MAHCASHHTRREKSDYVNSSLRQVDPIQLSTEVCILSGRNCQQKSTTHPPGGEGFQPGDADMSASPG
eukprot:4978750-Amphidinium_carterae.1